jgi:hypothetical protein
MPTAEQQLKQIRKVLPKQFEKRFEKLFERQKSQLVAIVGSPPDISKVKASHWKKWENEQAAALLALMLGYTLSQMNTAFEEIQNLEQSERERQRTEAAIQQRAAEEMQRRARFAAESISNTTQNRLANGSSPEDVITTARARMISITEMTAARSVAVSAIYHELVDAGVACELVWRTRPCQHCDVCPLLDGTVYSFWSRFVPSGPPMHPHCCCVLELLFGEYNNLLVRGRIARLPPRASAVRQAIQRSGFKIR